MRVILYQNDPVFGQVERNVADLLDNMAGEEFDILVLPEFFATGYQFRDRAEALSLADRRAHGYTFEVLHDLARERRGLVVYGFPELAGSRLFNSALAVWPDGNHIIYRKTHLFDDEKDIFDPGDSGFVVFDFGGAAVGLMICFDWRFPEAARKLALLGAQVICHPSNLILPYCPDAMVTRALENNVFTITANRTGVEERTGKRLTFIGRSRIIDPGGRILAELGPSDRALLRADIDPGLADNKRINTKNDLFEDRRPEFY